MDYRHRVLSIFYFSLSERQTGMMTLDLLSDWVSNLGFPVVAYFLLFRLVTTTLDRNTQALTAMNMTLQDLRDTVRPNVPDARRSERDPKRPDAEPELHGSR
jgi:hypothetical protein